MAQVDVLRPVDSWQGGSEWSAEPSGTIHGVLSDDSDSTYVNHTSVLDHPLGIIYDTHTLPAGHGRHRVRQGLRLSGTTYIDSWLSSGTAKSFTGGLGWLAAGRFEASDPNTPQTIYGQWETSFIHTIFPDFTFGPTFDFRSMWDEFCCDTETYEAYVEVDCRHYPDFTPEVRDAVGVNKINGTITNTNRPMFVFGPVDYDGLNPREYGAVVEDSNGDVIFRFDGNGLANDILCDPLPPGNYSVTFYVASTIGSGSGASGFYNPDFDEGFDFEIDFQAEGPITTATVEDDGTVTVCAEDQTGFSWDSAVIEFRRTFCDDVVSVGSVAYDPEGCIFDLFPPFVLEGDNCDAPEDQCCVQYQARIVGEVSGVPLTTEWSEPTECVQLLSDAPGTDLIRGIDGGGMRICPQRSWTRSKPFSSYQSIQGGRPTVTSGRYGGRDFTLSIPTTTLDEFDQLKDILAQRFVYYAPCDLPAQWMAPQHESIQTIQVGRIRMTTVSFVAVDNP